MDLSQRLQNLNVKSQQKILNLLSKLENKQELPETQEGGLESTEGKQDRSIRRPPITQVQHIADQDKSQQPIGRIKKKKKSTNQPRENKYQKQHKKVAARKKALDLTGNRKNLFVERGFANLHKDDIEIDKKLSGHNKPLQRNIRNNSIEVECKHCGDLWKVPSKTVFHDEEGIQFVCDDCQTKRGVS